MKLFFEYSLVFILIFTAFPFSLGLCVKDDFQLQKELLFVTRAFLLESFILVSALKGAESWKVCITFFLGKPSAAGGSQAGGPPPPRRSQSADPERSRASCFPQRLFAAKVLFSGEFKITKSSYKCSTVLSLRKKHSTLKQ